MEKILKRIIIVLSFVWFLTIPKVSADELTDLYLYGCTSSNCTSLRTSQLSGLVSSDLTFSTYNKYLIHLLSESTKDNYFIFYNSSDDSFFIVYYLCSRSNTSCDLKYDTTNYSFYDYVNGYKTSNLKFIYFNKTQLSNTNINGINFSLFKSLDDLYAYYYEVPYGTWSYTIDFNNFFNNFVYLGNSFNYKFYLNNDEVNVSQPEEPEPEEPEPEEPEPESIFKDLIYVPNYKKGQCVEILDKDTIRVFDDEYTNAYIDYYINSHYLSKGGLVDYSYAKNCSNLEFTDIRYYGNDISDILILLVCIIAFTIIPCYMLFKVFYRR